MPHTEDTNHEHLDEKDTEKKSHELASVSEKESSRFQMLSESVQQRLGKLYEGATKNDLADRVKIAWSKWVSGFPENAASKARYELQQLQDKNKVDEDLAKSMPEALARMREHMGDNPQLTAKMDKERQETEQRIEERRAKMARYEEKLSRAQEKIDRYTKGRESIVADAEARIAERLALYESERAQPLADIAELEKAIAGLSSESKKEPGWIQAYEADLMVSRDILKQASHRSVKEAYDERIKSAEKAIKAAKAEIEKKQGARDKALKRVKAADEKMDHWRAKAKALRKFAHIPDKKEEKSEQKEAEVKMSERQEVLPEEPAWEEIMRKAMATQGPDETTGRAFDRVRIEWLRAHGRAPEPPEGIALEGEEESVNENVEIHPAEYLKIWNGLFEGNKRDKKRFEVKNGDLIKLMGLVTGSLNIDYIEGKLKEHFLAKKKPAIKEEELKELFAKVRKKIQGEED